MKRFLTLNFLFLLLCGLVLRAQTIQGQLKDSKSNAPVRYAQLSIANEKARNEIRYVNSDSVGRFKFVSVPSGNYVLNISLMGYQNFSKNLVVLADQAVLELGNVLMVEESHLLNAVTISGGTPNFSSQNGQLKIGIANNAFFKSSANLTDVFQKLPGLQVNPEGIVLLGSGATPTLFVDGKPLNMNGEEIQAYLSGLSPDRVESIEMINQPSGRYDGQYQGIIDIKLKRSASLGLRGTYNLRFQQNNNGLLDHSASLQYKTPKFAYGLNLNHSWGGTYYKYHSLQFLNSGDALTTNTLTITDNQNYQIQATAAFEPKEGHVIEAFLRTYQVNRSASNNSMLTTENQMQTELLAAQQSRNNSMPKQYNYAGGVNYDAKFKKGELHLLTLLTQIDNRQREDILNTDAINNLVSSHWKTDSRNNILIRSIQGDYTLPLSVGKLEFGGKYAYTSTMNDLRYDTLENGVFYRDPNRSNNFDYYEYISAGYLSYLGKKGKFNYSLSLRTEHTRTSANAITEGATARNYWTWLPSAGLTFEIDRGQQMSLNYSRRLTRPTFEALNPFRFYYSPRHYRIGNPYLQPSTTHLLSLSYAYGSLNVSLNIGREKDPMARYPEYDASTNILVFKGDNLPYRDFINFQAAMPITVNNWWRMNNNLGVYYNRELRPYFGRNFQVPVYNYTLSGSQVFTVDRLLIDLSYRYESRSGNSLYIFAPVYTFDVGLQKSWLKDRVNTKLAGQDLFDNGRRRLIFREKSIYNNDFYHDVGLRRLVFSVSYHFGSSTYRVKEARKTEEENRTN